MLRAVCPCDYSGFCPYNAEYSRDCEYWCGENEPEDFPEECWDEYDFDAEEFPEAEE